MKDRYKNIELRNNIIKEIRSFFEKLNFLEIETPIRIPVPIPESGILIENSGDWILQTSPELCMKRLISKKFNKIYQICKCFRKEERGIFHLPEMTLLEWYEVDSSYIKIMEQCESLIKSISNELGFGKKIIYNGKRIDLSSSWEKLTVHEAFERFSSIDIETALISNRFDEIMSLEIQPKLGENTPVFLYDYPIMIGALAKLNIHNLFIAERFELYCSGIELCNGFSELTDMLDQKRRFQWENLQSVLMGKDIYSIPYLFLKDLKNMPSASGNAFGLDRLVMLFSDAKKIDEVLTFVPEEL